MVFLFALRRWEYIAINTKEQPWGTYRTLTCVAVYMLYILFCLKK